MDADAPSSGDNGANGASSSAGPTLTPVTGTRYIKVLVSRHQAGAVIGRKGEVRAVKQESVVDLL